MDRQVRRQWLEQEIINKTENGSTNVVLFYCPPPPPPTHTQMHAHTYTHTTMHNLCIYLVPLQ